MTLDECKVNLLLLGWKVNSTNVHNVWISTTLDIPKYMPDDIGVDIHDLRKEGRNLVRIYSYDELLDYLIENPTCH